MNYPFQNVRSDFLIVQKMSDWDKLLVCYQLYNLMVNAYSLYHILIYYDNQIKLKNIDGISFQRDFFCVYIFLYCICNVQNSYLAIIYKIYQTNPNTAKMVHEKCKDYFCFV